MEQLTGIEVLLRRHQMQMLHARGAAIDPHRGQGRVLAILKMQPEIGQKELGYLLDMSKQALAELLSKLEKSGYITRTQSEKDRRAYIIKLTEAGAAAEEISSEAPHEAGKFLDCLNEEELNTFSEYLERIIKGMKEEFPLDDESAFIERIREEFFAHHGFGDHRHGMQWLRHRFGGGLFGRFKNKNKDHDDDKK